MDATAYRGNQHRSTEDLLAWHAGTTEERVLEPEWPIVDPHHHLFNTPADRLYYLRDDLEKDLQCGHRVLGTVYVGAYRAGWRETGPQEMRSVGEVERIVKLSQRVPSADDGACEIAAGIVSEVDLEMGDNVAAVLDAHVAAGAGRLRGVRCYATHIGGALANFIPDAPRDMMTHPDFRRGVSQLRPYELSLDVLVYHTQLRELASLADVFPDTTFVLNHVGMPIGVMNYASERQVVWSQWQRDMLELAKRPNVKVKVGGMGMPILGFGFEHGVVPANTQTLAQAWSPLIHVCLDAFGASRCMFESNFPVDKQSCSYVSLWNAFKQCAAGFSRQERESLFYRTACQTYSLRALELRCDLESV